MIHVLQNLVIAWIDQFWDAVASLAPIPGQKTHLSQKFMDICQRPSGKPPSSCLQLFSIWQVGLFSIVSRSSFRLANYFQLLADQVFALQKSKELDARWQQPQAGPWVNILLNCFAQLTNIGHHHLFGLFLTHCNLPIKCCSNIQPSSPDLI